MKTSTIPSNYRNTICLSIILFLFTMLFFPSVFAQDHSEHSDTSAAVSTEIQKSATSIVQSETQSTVDSLTHARKLAEEAKRQVEESSASAASDAGHQVQSAEHQIDGAVDAVVDAVSNGIIPESHENTVADEHKAGGDLSSDSHGTVDGETAEHGAATADEEEAGGHGEAAQQMPSVIMIAPFVILLLCIAILPLIHKTEEWWEKNQSKLLVAAILGIITCIYYFARPFGFPEHGGNATATGLPALLTMLHHAVIADYIPFIILLFSLYTISGGINLKGDIPAHPVTNTAFIAVGTLLASLIGTTGVAMLLIRPLLQINFERKHVKHTVIFFIFLVCNIGGSLLPIGDPPLFLGYLRGVPFMWTISLTPQWAMSSIAVLIVYFIWDSVLYRKEEVKDIVRDETQIQPMKLSGKRNFLLLIGVVFSVALLVPGKPFLGKFFVVPDFMREAAQIALAGISMLWTSKQIRKDNDFNFFAIIEVACLFIGIFITMQVPVEILKLKGPELGLIEPWHFFWATGSLSSFLDNAPTYVVFFATAGTLSPPNAEMMTGVQTATGSIPINLLSAISCGAVFMGAMTYIGNGPNFMVKSIAEQSNIKMPSFFGYMGYSCLVLLPIYIIVSLVFF